MRYPEKAAGGFSRVDGNIAFYQRVQALAAECPSGATIVDFGAGRGLRGEATSPYKRELYDLRRPGRRVIGIDVDAAVLENPLVDEAHLVEPGGRLPIEDATVDLVVSDYTFEHVATPGHAAEELHRVLKPGGWICARTPNRWGYIAIGARAVPNERHIEVLRRLQPTKRPEDTFPTEYRLNTRSAIRKYFPADRFELAAMYTWDAEPDLYAGKSKLLAAAIGALRLLPPSLRSMWLIFLRKR
jgi:SAM-dependent methyltransferase